MLVVPRDGEATLVVPQLEAPRVVEQPGVFTLAPWAESADPVEIVARLCGRGVDGRRRRPDVGPLPRRAAAAPARRVVPPRRRRRRPAARRSRTTPRSPPCAPPARPPIGSPPSCTPARSPSSGAPRRRCPPTSRPGSSPRVTTRSTSPSSPPARTPPARTTTRPSRVIEAGEIVLCDFGGTMDGYCSDITRCVFTGEPPAEIAEAYAVLHAAQAAGVAAATVGTPCEDVDRAAREVIADAGFGDYFIHRTGHGIGLEEHEDPYIVAGNTRTARRRSRLQRRARHLRRRPVGDAPRGHRRRHRRRARSR